MTERIGIDVVVNAKGAETGAKQAVSSLNALDSAATKTEAKFKSLNGLAATLGTTLAGVASVVAVRSALDLADRYSGLEQRVKQATAATGDFARVNEGLFAIAQRTGSAFSDTVDVFQRLGFAAESLGASNNDILRLVQTVQQLGVISGASTTAMSAGLMQFSQALGSGVVRAEEFNSILENLPAVADKIAKGFGSTVAEVRKAVNEGKVLSKDVFEILLSQSEDVAEQFESMPDSLSRASQSFKNSLGAAFSDLDQKLGATKALSGLVREAGTAFEEFAADSERVSETLDTLGTAAVFAGSVFTTRLAVSAYSAAAAFVATNVAGLTTRNVLITLAGVSQGAAAGFTNAALASRALSASLAFLAGPVGIIAAATALTYFITQADESEEATKKLKQETDNYRASVALLAEEQARADMDRFTRGQAEQLALVGKLEKQIADKFKQLTDAQKIGGERSEAIERTYLRQLDQLQTQLDGAKTAMGEFGKQAVLTFDRLLALKDITEETGGAVVTLATNPFEKMIASLNEQAATFGKTEEFARRYSAEIAIQEEVARLGANATNEQKTAVKAYGSALLAAADAVNALTQAERDREDAANASEAVKGFRESGADVSHAADAAVNSGLQREARTAIEDGTSLDGPAEANFETARAGLRDLFALQNDEAAAAFEDQTARREEEFEAAMEQVVGFEEQEAELRALFDADKENQKREHEARLTGIQAEFVDKRKALDDAETQMKLSAAKFMLGQLEGLMSSRSRKLFEIGKAAAVANALVKTYEAGSDAYAYGAKIGGPYVGAAFAAVAVLAQLQNVQRIKNTSFGSSGGGGSPGGGASPSVGASDAPLPSQAPQQVTNSQTLNAGGGSTITVEIGTINGGVASTSELTSQFRTVLREEIAPVLGELFDRDVVVIRSTTRQGAELAGNR